MVLFGIGLLGFWIVARRIIPKDILQVLSTLALDVAVPCMVFSDIIVKFDPAADSRWWMLPVWWAAFSAAALFFSLGFSLFVNRGIRREFSSSLFYPNAVFFPLAIIPSLFGADNPLLVELYLFTLFFPVLLFNSAPLFFRKAGAGKTTRLRWRRVANPILVATVAAILLRLSGAHQYVPDVVVQITKTVGGISIPLIMLLIGGSIFVDMERRGKIHLMPVLGFIFAKNILFPAAALLILFFVKLPPQLSILIFLESAVPPVTAMPVLVERYGGDVSAANQFLLGSFIASLVTLPLAILAYAHLIGFGGLM